MTSIEKLREEMIKKGATKQQAESKAAALAFSICTEKPEIIDSFDLTKEIEILERRERDLSGDVEHEKYLVGELYRKLTQLNGEYDSLKTEAMRETEEYIKKFLDSIEKCETAEARDAMRTAQMFVNSVDVDKKYDYTAFVTGLASILSNGHINGIDKLKKINKNMFAKAGRRL